MIEQLDEMLAELDQWHAKWLQSLSILDRATYDFEEYIKQQHNAETLRRVIAERRRSWVQIGWNR